MRKTKFIAVATAALSLAALSSCGQPNSYQIGILLPVEHVALQTCRDGFKEAIMAANLDKQVTFVERNAGGKNADLIAFAKDLVSSSNMTFGLGTDASVALKSASIDKGIINPVLFSAVTDPVDAGLVKSLANGSGFVTGTTDAQPVGEQIDLITQLLADADKIGIIYTQSESNSRVQANQAQAAALAAELEVSIKTVTGPSDISATALALASEVGMDAIYVPTDNNLAANMNAIKSAAESNHVLVVAGEEGMLTNGGHVTLSIDYRELGKKAGEMAVKIIKGEKNALDIPVTGMTSDECKYVYSSKNVASAGIVLPEWFTSIAEDISK